MQNVWHLKTLYQNVTSTWWFNIFWVRRLR